MLTRLRNLDADAKRGAFVIAGLYALLFAAGLVLFVATGVTGLMLAAVVLFGSTVGLVALCAALWQAALRLFPDAKD